MEVLIIYPSLPLTTNHAYATVRGSHRVLKTEGKKWKRNFYDFLWEKHGDDLDALLTSAGEDQWLLVSYYFFFDSLVNASFLERHKTSLPERPGKRKGKKVTLPEQVAGTRKSGERFKRLDASNRLKLIEDGLSEALGVDDSRFQMGSVLKYMDPDNPRTEVLIEVVNPMDFGVPKEYVRDLRRAMPRTRYIHQP